MKNMKTDGFATLDRQKPVDPIEGHIDQFVIEFRDSDAAFVDRIYGTRAACFSESFRRGFAASQVRVTGRAQQ